MRAIVCFSWIFLMTLAPSFAQEGYENLRTDEVRVFDGRTFFIHQVKRGHTLYSISKAYGVEMQEIIDANPAIKDGLKASQTLLIPAGPQKPSELPPPLEPPAGDPTGSESSLLHEDSQVPPAFVDHTGRSPCSLLPGSMKKTYHVALMMHLYLAEADSIKTEYPTQEEIESYNPLRYLQFYEGLLLAVDSLQKCGLNLNLYVYDVGTDPASTYSVLRKPEMTGMDLIIGMLFNRNFQIVANWALEHRIPVVSPVSERESQVEGNPMVIKISPSSSSEGIALAEYLSRHHPYSPVLIARSWEPDVRRMSDKIVSNCKALGMNVAVVDENELTGRLTRGTDNLVVVISNQKSFALNILSKLNADTLGYRFTVFGLPRWDQFDGMDFQYLERARAHVLVPSWIDYSDPAVARFVNRFRERFKTEPDPLAFQGYEVAWFFLNALKQYGPGFIDCLREVTIRPLQTVYKFRQEPGDGWENHHWEMFVYKDYSRIPLN